MPREARMTERTGIRDMSQIGSNQDKGDAMYVRGDSQMVKAQEVQAVRRGRGRPVGSKNRPHGLIPKELASEFLGVVKSILPEEHYEEMRLAIKEGKSISVLSEAKITLKLMGPPIWKRLIDEGTKQAQAPAGIDADMVDEIGTVPPPAGFSRDLNERMKIYMGLMEFIDKSERRNDEGTPNSKKPILEIFARRGVDGDRLRLLIGVESGSVGGDADKFGRQAISSGALPDTLPQRSVNVPDTEQEPTDGSFTDDISGDSTLGQYEEQL
jgi:hypothetical protein